MYSSKLSANGLREFMRFSKYIGSVERHKQYVTTKKYAFDIVISFANINILYNLLVLKKPIVYIWRSGCLTSTSFVLKANIDYRNHLRNGWNTSNLKCGVRTIIRYDKWISSVHTWEWNGRCIRSASPKPPAACENTTNADDGKWVGPYPGPSMLSVYFSLRCSQF